MEIEFKSDLGLDLGLDNINVDIGQLPTITLAPIAVGITDLPPIVTTSTVAVAITELPPIKTESTVALDLKLAITELPKIRLEFGFKPMRVHFPTHYQFCFSVLGREVFKFALCGESMVACEDYLPHETEKCG
jgi:hypothetical protein